MNRWCLLFASSFNNAKAQEREGVPLRHTGLIHALQFGDGPFTGRL